MNKGLIIVNTGNGKGKTTAAFGMILRAVGHKKKSAVVQFIKSEESGEITALKALAPELVQMETTGLGFTWLSENLEKDKAAALRGWQLAKDIIASNSVAILLLDEITYPINMGMIPEKEVVEVLEKKPESLHIIITGRDASEKIRKVANCVSEINSAKHHYQDGISSQIIIES